MLRHLMSAVVATAVMVLSVAAFGQEALLPSPLLLQQPGVQDQLRALPAAPGALFAEPPHNQKSGIQNSGIATQKSTTPGVSRARSTTVDGAYLRRLVGVERLQVTPSGRVAGTPPRFTLNLF